MHRTPCPTTHTRRTRALLVGGLLAGALLAGGCSDDDAASTADIDDTPTTTAALLGAPVDAAACEGFAALSAAMTGDPSQAGDALDAFESSLPDDLVEDGTTVVDSFRAALDGDEAAMGSEDFSTSFAAIGSAMFDGCPASDRLDVTGIDYGFEGMPTKVTAGTVAVRFSNETSNAEPHELIVLARSDGDDTPLDQIAAMPPDELMARMPMAGLVFADRQGAESTSFMDLEPGSYVAICTIPVGGGESGDPHATHGMIAEFKAV